MAVDDVFPRRNLPGEAEEWGRTLEGRIQSSELDVEVLAQSLKGLNRSSASSIEDIARQVQDIAANQQAIQVAQANITVAQAGIVATQNFLLGQTSFAAKNTTFNYIGTGNIFAYDPTYDCEVTVTAGSTGRLWCQVIAGCQGSGISKGPVVGIEAFWSGGSYSYANDQGVDASAWRYTGTVTRAYMLNVPANAVVTVRTRRGASNTANEQILVQGQSLSVTKVGI